MQNTTLLADEPPATPALDPAPPPLRAPDGADQPLAAMWEEARKAVDAATAREEEQQRRQAAAAAAKTHEAEPLAERAKYRFD